MKIKKIKKLSNGKYNIIFDNNEVVKLYDEVILNNNILYKNDISNELFEKIILENTNYEIYTKILKYINIKMRSEYEIKKYLDRFNIDRDKQVKIIENLKCKKFINDQLYIESYISDKINLTNDGPYKIKKELLKHELDEDLIDKEFYKYDAIIYLNKIKKIVSNKQKNNKDSLYTFKRKMLSYLINLGYDKNMIMSILETVKVDNKKFIQKDYDKLYNRLSKKYSDEKLEYEIIHRLYQKGYSSDDIEVIKKSD